MGCVATISKLRCRDRPTRPQSREGPISSLTGIEREGPQRVDTPRSRIGDGLTGSEALGAPGRAADYGASVATAIHHRAHRPSAQRALTSFHRPATTRRFTVAQRSVPFGGSVKPPLRRTAASFAHEHCMPPSPRAYSGRPAWRMPASSGRQNSGSMIAWQRGSRGPTRKFGSKSRARLATDFDLATRPASANAAACTA
jgi:hypothetical protein